MFSQYSGKCRRSYKKLSLTSCGQFGFQHLHPEGENLPGKVRGEVALVLTRLGGLHMPALHMGLQEGVIHEGFVTEVTLEREKKSAEVSLWRKGQGVTTVGYKRKMQRRASCTGMCFTPLTYTSPPHTLP